MNSGGESAGTVNGASDMFLILSILPVRVGRWKRRLRAAAPSVGRDVDRYRGPAAGPHGADAGIRAVFRRIGVRNYTRRSRVQRFTAGGEA